MSAVDLGIEMFKLKIRLLCHSTKGSHFHRGTTSWHHFTRLRRRELLWSWSMRPLRIDGFSRVPLLSEVPSKIEIFKHVRDFYGAQNEDFSQVLWETIFFSKSYSEDAQSSKSRVTGWNRWKSGVWEPWGTNCSKFKMSCAQFSSPRVDLIGSRLNKATVATDTLEDYFVPEGWRWTIFFWITTRKNHLAWTGCVLFLGVSRQRWIASTSKLGMQAGFVSETEWRLFSSR